ncbi:MAG: lipopolysaccharide biosynthesis protein [Bacteroidota bacterium]
MNKAVEAKRLNKDAAFVYGGYLLRYLSLIVLLPFYSRILGPTGYGKVLAAMSLVSIVWLVVNYGFSITGARDLASVAGEGQRNRIYGRQLLARLLLLPVGAAVGAVGTMVSPILAADPIYGVLATIIGTLEAFNLGWFFQGLRQFRTSIAVEALSYPLNAILVLALVRNGEDGIWVLVSLLLSVLVVLALSYHIAGKSISLAWPSVAEGWAEIKGSTVIFIQGVNTVLTTAGATYLLSILSTAEEVSYFGTAERFVAVGLSLFGPAGQVLMPTIASLHLESRGEAFALARKALALETAFGLVAMVAGVLLAPFVLPIVLGDKFDDSVFLLQILVCLMPFAAITHALGLYLLVPLRRENLLILAISIGSVLNLGFGIFAAQAWDSVGMAVARVAGEAVAAILLALMCLKIKRA